MRYRDIPGHAGEMIGEYRELLPQELQTTACEQEFRFLQAGILRDILEHIRIQAIAPHIFFRKKTAIFGGFPFV